MGSRKAGEIAIMRRQGDGEEELTGRGREGDRDEEKGRNR